MDKNRVSVLYLFPEPLPLQKARGIQVINTVASLANQGVQVYLAYVPVAAHSDPFAAYGLPRPERVTLVPLSRGLPWPLSFIRVHSGRLFFRRLMAWIRSMKFGKGSPVVVMVRHVKLANEILQAGMPLPIVYEAHEIFADGAPPEKASALAKLEAFVLDRSNEVIAITEQLALKLRQRYAVSRPIAIVPSATSLPSAVCAKDWDKPGRSIIYAGSLYGWKGAQDLVAAARYLSGCRITIIGGSEEEIDRLRGALTPEGAEVEFLGHRSHREVMDTLSRTCIAVLPNRRGSVSEFTSPLKLFEYMASGCAIVVSDLPVFHEVLEPGEASWFEPGDAEQLALAIRHLADNPAVAERLGARMAEKAKRYTWQARAERLIELLVALGGVSKQEKV